MALWDRLSSRGNVEDRRSMAPAIGGLSLTGVAVLLLLNVLTGGEAGDIIGQIQNLPVEGQQAPNSGEFAGEDSYEKFASTVLGSNNDVWTRIFGSIGLEYQEPRLVLFRNATQSGCGTATSQVGPHYCPLDGTIYLDETFFDELTTRLGAQRGDVAEAYVIAHEVGHHAQNIMGTMDQFQNNMSNENSINLELQADCYAGLWANSIKSQGVFEEGEIREAMDAAAAVGDDRIQEKATGYSNPESWTHGSSDQRVEWFNRGYTSGEFTQCDTF